MGWGTWTNAEIYFHKETYDSKYQLEEAKEECKEDIERAKKWLMIYALTDPKLHITKDIEGNTDSLHDVVASVEDFIELLQESTNKLYKLNLLQSNWDKRQGDFINKTAEDLNKETES